MIRAIKVGWPGYPAFKDREIVSSPRAREVIRKVSVEAEAKALEAVALVTTMSWTDAAKSLLRGLGDMGEAINKQATLIAKAAAEASYTEWRQLPDRDESGEIRRDAKGNVILVPTEYTSAHTVASATARLAEAAKNHAQLAKGLLESIAPGERPQILSGPPALTLFMPESDDVIEPLPKPSTG